MEDPTPPDHYGPPINGQVPKCHGGVPRSVHDSQHSIRNGEHKMNSKLWMVLSASLLAVLWIGIGNPSSSDAGSENSGKAVIIQCVVENTNPDPAGNGPFIIRVFASSSSAGAPVVSSGGECAQAIASVLAAGFQLNNVEINLTYGPLYTLIK